MSRLRLGASGDAPSLQVDQDVRGVRIPLRGGCFSGSGRTEVHFSVRCLFLWSLVPRRRGWLWVSEGIFPLPLGPGPWHLGGHMAMDGPGTPGPRPVSARVPGRQAGPGAGTAGA